MVPMPDSEWIWMVELRGAIQAFSRDTDTVKHQVLQLKEVHPNVSNAFGLAFHPEFDANRTVFLCYVLGGSDPNGTRVSSFQVSNSDPPSIIPESEKVLITWKGGGHNAGCLRFGPDGYLYISTGDASGPNPPDILKTGQDNSDLLSCILRIDVDREENGRAYGIPDDNPFINDKEARSEIWAFGFRNPFKMSFDPYEGFLWVGDVGWELWELIFRVEKGGNYGWSIMEGHQEIQPDNLKGPGDFIPPIVDHPHSEAASITGGYVYKGKRLTDLKGAYIYGDWETGKIWALKLKGEEIEWHRELVDTPHKIITFGEDQEGELYIVDYAGGLYELIPNDSNAYQNTFPAKLSDTGLFEDVARHKMISGVYPYQVEMEPWENGAIAKRFVALPNFEKVRIRQKISEFPEDAVIIKTLFWPSDQSLNRGELPLETQMLHFDGQSWNAYTYAWDAGGKDGFLVGKEGETVTEESGELMVGVLCETEEMDFWKFSSRSDCLRCHNSWSGFALGWNSLQLQGTVHARPALKRSWENLKQSDLFLSETPKPYKHPTQLSELDYKAKSYLHANCAHCHRENAGGMVNSLMYFEKPLVNASLVGSRPLRGDFNLPKPEVISPGDPFSSVLYYRMAKSGSGKMPHLGRTELDKEGLNLIFEWIHSLPTEGEGKENHTNTTLEKVRNLLRSNERLMHKKDLIGLMKNPEGALAVAYAIDHHWLNENQLSGVKEVYDNLNEAHSREILSRFFEKVRDFQNDLNIEEILAKKPNIENGKQLFFNDPSLQCSVCHQFKGRGGSFGPDLTNISEKYTRRQILEHIAYPSQTIDPIYKTVSIETTEGFILSGMIVEEDEKEMHLRAMDGNIHRIKKSIIVDRQISNLSAMPEGLLNGRSSQNVADLIGVLRY